MTRAAAGTAATASGQPRGLITAQASTTSSAMTDSDSAAAVPSPISRWDLPVPESPTRQHGCPAATHAPLARVWMSAAGTFGLAA